MPGKEPVRFFEMNLKRVGDTTWPAGGAIGPTERSVVSRRCTKRAFLAAEISSMLKLSNQTKMDWSPRSRISNR